MSSGSRNLGFRYCVVEPPEQLLKAGVIAARVRDESRELVRSGASCREICEKLESRIVELGASPAFPCNISISHIAAHYTPGIRDDCVVGEDDVVKIDVGAEIEGYIADTAVTVSLSEKHLGLVEASRAGLEAAMRVLKPGVRLYDIGKAVESAVRARGFKVIKNLSGHTIDRYTIHAGISIPNYADRAAWIRRIQPGTIFAIEPFTTTGRGYVVESSTVNIYAYTGKGARKAVLGELESRIMDYIESKFKTLPFTPRWLPSNMGSPNEIESALKLLAKRGILHAYPVLVEAGRGVVAQSEHTFYATKSGVIVVTDREQPEL
ncbi:MAG: type II methionyl aminopeptidase [Aeropyrum sp.]|nr:type II methionyl aminopeptidase [Aeropyrum sp.]MCE4616067.1 type II methionyl aminopeptidase [Aeropyrum sp.]